MTVNELLFITRLNRPFVSSFTKVGATLGKKYCQHRIKIDGNFHAEDEEDDDYLYIVIILQNNSITLAQEDVFRSLLWKQKCINIEGRSLNLLRFADDIILFVSDTVNWQK